MSGHRQISWPGLLAAATVVLAAVAALRCSEWGHDLVERLIERPLTEVMRLAW